MLWLIGIVVTFCLGAFCLGWFIGHEYALFKVAMGIVEPVEIDGEVWVRSPGTDHSSRDSAESPSGSVQVVQEEREEEDTGAPRYSAGGRW